jgi:type IV secretion system protein VirB11
LIRPVSPPTFVIRKQLQQVIPLTQHVDSGTLTAAQADVLLHALRQRWNIVLVGATLSGKTVVANSLLDALRTVCGAHLRLVLIEDTYELRCTAPNVVHLHTCDAADLRTLVQDTLRLRPDRIIVGEVRGAEALELLKSWNTGHPGGITTVHADTAAQALLRLESLMEEAGVRPNPRMIATTIHLLVMMARVGSRQWRVQELLRVHGWDARTQCYHVSQIQSLQEVYDETQSHVFRNNDRVAATARVELGWHDGNGAAVGPTDDHH